MAYSPSTFLYLTVFTIVGYYILNAIRVKFTYYTGCKRPLNYPHKDPVLGLDLFLIYKKAFESGTFLETDRQLYKLYSKTFETNSFGTTLIKTIEPENAKVVYSTSFKNFGLQPLRYNTAENLFGNGIIVVDGPLWAHSRALIRTSFETVHITNINFLSPHVNRFMDLLPRDGSTVDLLPLLKRLVCIIRILSTRTKACSDPRYFERVYIWRFSQLTFLHYPGGVPKLPGILPVCTARCWYPGNAR